MSVRYSRVNLKIVSACITPAVFDSIGSGVVVNLISNPEVEPGSYSYQIGSAVASMSVGAGGIILSSGVSGPIEPVGSGFTQTGSGAFVHTHFKSGPLYAPSVSVSAASDCGVGGRWQLLTAQESTEISPVYPPTPNNWFSLSGGSVVRSSKLAKVDGFKSDAGFPDVSWGDYVDPDPPAGEIGGSVEAVYNCYAPGVTIPPEDIPKYKVKIENGNKGGGGGGGGFIRVCVSSQGTGLICYDPIEPGTEVEIEIPTLTPDPPLIYIEDPDGEITIIEPPPWDPNDPDDPTNYGDPYTIYVPPITPDPDPNPNPNPNPNPDESGNGGDFQGCVSAPCAIPYLYKYKSQ